MSKIRYENSNFRWILIWTINLADINQRFNEVVDMWQTGRYSSSSDIQWVWIYIKKTVHPIFQRIFRNILNVVTLPYTFWNPTLATYSFESGHTMIQSKNQTCFKVWYKKVLRYKVREYFFYGIFCSISMNIHDFQCDKKIHIINGWYKARDGEHELCILGIRIRS